MTIRLRTATGPILALAIGCLISGLASTAVADVEAMRAAAVKITVEHGAGVEAGSGILLCQGQDRVDILTAKHVVTGLGLVDENGRPVGERFRDVRKIEVAFYRNVRQPVVVMPREIQSAEFKDLAVLTLRGVGGRVATAALGSSVALAAPREVQSVGHHLALRDGDWFHTDGKVRRAGEFILHSAGIGGAGAAAGFSGGPLYDRAGEVVGINIQTVGGVARAIPIEEAVRTARPWLDPRCLGGGVGVPPPPERPGRWKDPVLGIEFVYAPPSSFWMGSPASETGRDGDERRHRVTLTRGFQIATTEVTQGQFGEFVAETGHQTEAEKRGYSWVWSGTEWEKREGATWRDSGGRDHPVVHVSWDDAQAFCRWLSQRSGKTIRLPTEAEWEYAARAATSTATYAGDLDIRGNCDAPELEAIAWYCGNSDGKSHPVGQKRANDWGLHDTLGSVWEWTEDAADWDAEKSQVVTDTYDGDMTDPLSIRGARRVARGGSWRYFARYCRAADRDAAPPGYRNGDLGFRLVRTLP